MIRFQEKHELHVDKCDRKTVVALCEKMEAEGKMLPFVVLDEMTPNMNIDGGGENLAAFQRNVFRVCGLVVVVMGTDAKITNLVGQSGGSYNESHNWMTIISRFPPYQAMGFADEKKQDTWNRLRAEYPVLNNIVKYSRGRFARHFVDKAAQYAVGKSIDGIRLCDLLDTACGHVSQKTQTGKKFMGKPEGQRAQLMAISYTNVGNVSNVSTSPPPRKKKKVVPVGIECMHLHFANLVDDQATEVEASDGELFVNEVLWKPWCSFPKIHEDLLLYLAVLGGKTYSGYYDHPNKTDHSTLHIFSRSMKGPGFSTRENTNAVSNNYKTFENMVAHMIFCASRRNGVQGIPFDDFFTGLLSECQDKIRFVTMTIGDTGETIVASDLLATYADPANLSATDIPFLAPPNAKWPQWILGICTPGCNFGRLVRPRNDKRCDMYVCMEGLSKPLFLCECKYWNQSVDSGAMDRIIKGLESAWEEDWAVALVFCVSMAKFRKKKKWNHENVGCVKVDCRNGRVDWVFQPAEGNRKKLVIAMETGSLELKTHVSVEQSST